MSISRAAYFLILFSSISVLGQGDFNYQSPLDIPLVLAANFGELRPHHFHMGLDFKTNSKEGYVIRSIQDGFVSRVKISRSGYGKVVYVEHNNGHTSVYAHCSSFKGQIDSLVKAVQAREQNAEIEIYLKKDEIKVKRGQIIALSGNTGGSTGPHLHFELRETATETGLNPLLYGFHISDHRAPEIKGVKISALDSSGFTIPGKTIISAVKKTKDGYLEPISPIILPSDFCSKSGGIGFAFEVIDRFDDALNNCGLFASELMVNNEMVFTTKIDKIPFDESRHINCHKDHNEFLKGKDYHRCYKTMENPLGMYDHSNRGIVHVVPGEKYAVNFKTWDVKNNSTFLRMTIAIAEGDFGRENNFPPSEYFLPNEKMDLTNGTVFISSEANTLYEPLKKEYSLLPPYTLGQNRIPIQKNLRVQIPTERTSNQYLEILDEKGRSKSIFAEHIEGALITRPKNLGKFTVKTDTIPPVVFPLDLTSNTLKWKVKESETELYDYDLFIDDQWILLEYESKSDLLFALKPKGISGDRIVRIVVSDTCNNSTEWVQKISFK